MKPFFLSDVTTRDGLVHQGIFFRPKHPGKRALVWVHGLTGKFYGDSTLMNYMTDICDGNGWGFASFNNRGHGFMASIHKVDPKHPESFTYVNGGAGYEIFADCIHDIHAVVDFMVSEGFEEIFLVGHSTGALKVCYSEGTNPHPNVKGIVLTGPLSDQLDPALDKEEIAKNLIRMRQLVTEGLGEVLQTGLFFFPMTPKRYLSLFSKGSVEEVFDYGESKPKMSTFHAITKPVFVIISEKDEYLDRPAEHVLIVFASTTGSKKYTGIVFPDANHGFEGKEKEAVSVITEWISSV